MPARKKRVVRKKSTRTTTRKTRKTTKRKTPVKRAALSRGKTSRTKTKRVSKKTETTQAELKLSAIKRDADAQIICSVLLELDINHHEVTTDKDYMKLTMSPKDAVAFYCLLLQKITKPFKEVIDCSYKTNNCDWVMVSIPTGLMPEVIKLLSGALQSLKD